MKISQKSAFSRFFSFPSILFLFHLWAIPAPPTFASASVFITAPSAIVIEPGRKLFYAKTPHLKRAPASTTKILTAMVVLDHISPDRVVTIPRFVTSLEPTKANLRPGERFRVRDLLRAALIKSANDAAETLAVAVAGSRWRFAQLMNAKARSIGCQRSHFVNASGLPGGNQYSTAFDLMLIMKEAQRYPFIIETLKIKGVTIRSLQGRGIYLKSHNKMLWNSQRPVLGKTGWTRRARYCFVGLLQLPGKTVYVAMLGSRRLWTDLRRLIDSRFGRSWNSPARINQRLWSREQTKKIQMALEKAGFKPGPIDGKFGSKTVNAVKSFQLANSLKADGIVGPATWKKLKTHL
jgi:D-alanyl-D-alanine carboxypeptidase (penicillin-binding protein 5/6)